MYVFSCTVIVIDAHFTQYYIIPSHTPICMHFLDLMNLCTSIFTLYYECDINWVLQLPITSVVINVVSVESQRWWLNRLSWQSRIAELMNDEITQFLEGCNVLLNTVNRNRKNAS